MTDKFLDRMSGALQENVLTLLCWDTDSARLIRLLVDVELFDSHIYREIAQQAISFLDQYDEAIKDHLPDVLEDKLNSSDKKTGKLYERTLEHLYAAKAHMNSKYIVDQVQAFVHEQRFKSGLLKAYESVEAGKILEAENVMNDALNKRVTSFDAGTFFADPKQSLKFYDTLDNGIPIGIKELDQAGIMLYPGTMFLFIAPAKKGKSWACTHVGKFAMMQRKKVLHITLENSEDLTSQRYVMSLFSVSKRDPNVRIPMFSVDNDGKFLGVDFDEVERLTLEAPGSRKLMQENIARRFKKRSPLVIKRFPTGGLTVPLLEAYLDTLERVHKFIPDVLILDYPDLMEMKGDKREATGDVFKNLRGLLVKRNLAGFMPTQGNRESANSRMVTDTHVSEDYSKIMTADTAVTYSQTPEERRMGLARLFVSNARGDVDKFTVLITQAYGVGQFCLASRGFSDNYWDVIDGRRGGGDDDE